MNSSFFSLKKRAISCVECQEGVTYEGTAVKSIPMTRRRITNPMPQSSFSRKLSGESVCNQSQGLEDKDKQEWNAAYEDMVKKMLRSL